MSDFNNFSDYLNESRKITLKRRYTENHPAVEAGKFARVRNKMLEAIADGTITQEEFNSILKEFSADSGKWMRRNSRYFSVSEEGISLSKFGKRALSSVTVNEEKSLEEGRAFVAAAKKAKEEGKEEFEFDGKSFPVTIKENEKMKNNFTFKTFEGFINEDVFADLEDAISDMDIDAYHNLASHWNIDADDANMMMDFIYNSLDKKGAKELLKGIKKGVYESEEIVTEAFKSMKLQSILTSAGSMPKNFAKAFYNMAKIQLDQIQDVDIIEMDPDSARKEKRNKAVYLYFTDNEKENPYAGRNSWGVRTIPGNTLLAATDGRNEWLAVDYERDFGSKERKATLSKTNRNDGSGFGKSAANDTWGSGISSLTKAAELADRAYVLDLDVLRARYSTEAKRGERAAAKKGATAFKSDKDFKKENLNRYHDILANRAAQMPIDKEVKDAIDIVADQIKAGLESAKKGKYGDVIIGTDPKGRELRLRDASNAMSNLLDDFNRYVDYTESAKKEEEAGYGRDYYAREVKNYAKSIKDRINKIKKMDYAW